MHLNEVKAQRRFALSTHCMGLPCGVLLRRALLVLWLCWVSMPGLLLADAAARVSYDKTADRLSVSAQGVSLRTLMGQIALRSGIEVMMDARAERRVSVQIDALALVDAITQINQTGSVAFFHDSVAGEKPLLVGVQILPMGEEDLSGLSALVDMRSEAVLRDQSAAPDALPRPAILDRVALRWQARIRSLAPQERERVLAHVRQTREAQASALREQAALREAEQAQWQAEERERQAHLAQLRARDPAYYALMLQRQQDYRLAQE